MSGRLSSNGGMHDEILLDSIPDAFLTRPGHTPGAGPESSPTLIWDAPSFWIERLPILLANELQLWRDFGLPFDAVHLRVAGGGPELLGKVSSGEAHVGEI